MAGKKFKVSTVIKATDEFSRPVKGMSSALEKRFTPALKRSGKMAKKFTGALTGTVGKIGALVGVGSLGAAFYGVQRLTNAFIGSTDKLAKFGAQIGVSVEDLQRWAFVSEITGVGTDTLNSSLLAFAKRLGDAKNGVGPLVSTLKKMDPVLLNNLKNSKSTSEAFMIFMTALGEIKDESTATSLAAAAFSKSGSRVALMAKAGAKEIKALGDEAERFGILSGQDAKNAEAAADSITRLNFAAKGITNTLIAEYLPSLTTVTEKTGDFIAENKIEILERLNTTIEKITKSLTEIDTRDLLEGLEAILLIIEGMALGFRVIIKGLVLLKRFVKGGEIIGQTIGGAIGDLVFAGREGDLTVQSPGLRQLIEENQRRLASRGSINRETQNQQNDSKSLVTVEFRNAPAGTRVKDIRSNGPTRVNVKNNGVRKLAGAT